VVIAIIALLAGLLLPVLAKAKAKGQSVACLNNVRQLSLGWFLYAQDHEDRLALNIVDGTGGIWRNRPGSWVLGNAQVDTSPTNLTEGVLWSCAQEPANAQDQADLDFILEGTPRNRVARRMRRSEPRAWSVGGPQSTRWPEQRTTRLARFDPFTVEWLGERHLKPCFIRLIACRSSSGASCWFLPL